MDGKERGFLKDHFGSEPFQLVQLAGDASSRRYFRASGKGRSYVLMSWEPFEARNFPFLTIQKNWKSAGILVPDVIRVDEAAGMILLEDLTDETLEQKFWPSKNPKVYLPFYRQTLQELLKIHHQTKRTNEPCMAFEIEFNIEKYVWEMNYTRTHLLEGLLEWKPSYAATREIETVFFDVANRLYAEPKVVTHRDFHSRNVMIKDGRTYIIDFQDARMGPIQYDLVSLFKDSYTELPPDIVATLMDEYLEEARSHLTDFSREKFDHIYEIQSIQRCFKAAGSFASFFHLRKDRRYLKYLTPTLKRVRASLEQLPEYAPLLRVLVDQGAFETAYEAL